MQDKTLRFAFKIMYLKLESERVMEQSILQRLPDITDY